MGPGASPAKELMVFTACQSDERPVPSALSACKGQLQRLLQGVKPAAGSAGENLCFRFGFVTGRKEVPGCVAGSERASVVWEAKVMGWPGV